MSGLDDFLRAPHNPEWRHSVDLTGAAICALYRCLYIHLMPITINGIGTYYYGSGRRRNRRAICQACGRPAQLSTYDTRLWVVLIYIPVFPLGRYKVLDRCGVCEQQLVFPLKAWETGRLAELSTAMERYRREPAEDTAADVHAQLIKYHELETAEAFRRKAVEQFPQRAGLRAELAGHLEWKGLQEQAQQFWDEAVAIDAELPEVRLGLGRRALQAGDLDEARERLRFLEEPGAEQQHSLDVLFDLAAAYQHESNHTAALEIMEVLLKAFPETARDHQIRAFVLQSEKSLRRPDSILPRVDHSVDRLFTSQYSSGQRWGLGILAAVLLAAVGLLINNFYIRQHRTLTIVNDTGQPASIRINGEAAMTVDGMQQLVLPEGEHHVQITGPVQATHFLSMQTEFRRRWLDNPVWILNVGGEALIARLQIHYAANPRPPSYHFLTAPMVFLKHIDYPFTEPPDEMKLDSSVPQKTVSAVSWYQPGDQQNATVLNYFTLREKNVGQAIDYLLRKAVRNPYDRQVMQLLGRDVPVDRQDELEALLEQKLEVRPVSIPLHELYQTLPGIRLEYYATRQRYTDWLRQHPDDPALLYLAARFEADPRQAKRLLQSALEKEPVLPEVTLSLAAFALAAGDWQRALQLDAQATKQGLPADQNPALRHTARVALQQYEDAERELRQLLEETPSDLRICVLLVELLTIQERLFEVDDVYDQCAAAFQDETQGQFPESLKSAEVLVQYMQDDLTGILEQTASEPELHWIRSIVRLELGRAQEVADQFDWSDDPQLTWLPLQISLAWHLKAAPEQMVLWHDKQIEQLQRLGPRAKYYRTLLGSVGTAQQLVTRINQSLLEPPTQALLLLHAAVRNSDVSEKAALLDAARKKIFGRRPCVRLLRQVYKHLEAQP